MAGPLAESVDFFLKQVADNDTLTEDQKREFYERAIRHLAGGITDGTHLWGKSMVIGKLGQEAGQKRKRKPA